MFTLDATVDGVPQLINRLRGFEPAVWKILTTEIKAASDKVGASARGLIPSQPTSGWGQGGRTGWVQGKVQSSIKPGFRTQNVGGTRVIWGVVRSTNPAFNIWAAIGSKDNSRFGKLVNETSGTSYPRALGPAWRLHVDEAREGIITAIHAAAERVTNG